MNFITHEAAYSLYPLATFEKRCALVFIDDRGSERALAKYAARGFKMLKANVDFRKCRQGPYKDPLCSPGLMIDCRRGVGDRFTWVLPFSNKDGITVLSDSTGSPVQSDHSSTAMLSSGFTRCWKIHDDGWSVDRSTRFRVVALRRWLELL